MLTGTVEFFFVISFVILFLFTDETPVVTIVESTPGESLELGMRESRCAFFLLCSFCCSLFDKFLYV